MTNVSTTFTSTPCVTEVLHSHSLSGKVHIAAIWGLYTMMLQFIPGPILSSLLLLSPRPPPPPLPRSVCCFQRWARRWEAMVLRWILRHVYPHRQRGQNGLMWCRLELVRHWHWLSLVPRPFPGEKKVFLFPGNKVSTDSEDEWDKLADLMPLKN